MKYRKKPVVIEAYRFGNDIESVPIWLYAAEHEGVIFRDEENNLVVKTLKGNMIVSEGDYIIKGVKGELYPCKPDIFKMTYERV